MDNQIPVYLFTGFLEGGKTKFIQETLEDRRFNRGEPTLLIVCEEGVEEYAPEEFSGKRVKLKAVENEEDLTPENLTQWLAQAQAERVLIEYNGMWMLDSLYGALPEGWVVAQEFMFADANTFLMYNANMRQLTYDKLKSAELVVFNRFKPEMDKMDFHKIVRAANRRSDIAYEAADGSVVYDDIEDPLPFDIEAPVIEIADRDYALWYRDVAEEPKKYNGKTVRVKARCAVRKGIPDGWRVMGRHVMTCCEADIAFHAFVCDFRAVRPEADDAWYIVTAKMEYKFHRSYGRKGPVLTAESIAPCDPPAPTAAPFAERPGCAR